MKTNMDFGKRHFAIISASLILFCLLFSANLKAQSQLNFSGKWMYDKTKSTPGTNSWEYPGTVSREITQTATEITYRDVYIATGNDPFTGSDIVLKLDGKEEIDKSDPDFTITKSLKWASDKKSFTTTFKSNYTMDGVKKEILITETYSLSSDGKTLTIYEFHKAELGETKTTNIYQRK